MEWELVGKNENDHAVGEIIERMKVPGGWIYKGTYPTCGQNPAYLIPTWAVFVPFASEVSFVKFIGEYDGAGSGTYQKAER